MRQKVVSFSESGVVSSLMEDYLCRHERLTPFYNRFHTAESFGDQIAEKSAHRIPREELVEILSQQYARLLETPYFDRVQENIQSLLSPDTFTVTTGHQLVLGTGPLYFIYKILNTINLAEALSERYPTKKFVPIFWMATEDHDFEEINHFHYADQTFRWERSFGDAVGRLNVEGAKQIVEEALRHSGSPQSSALLNNWLDFYAQGTLAEATLQLVHHLFAEYGLVILDADRRELKASMIPYFEDEIRNSGAANAVLNTNASLGEHYSLQVTPRDINLFYLKDGGRHRLTRSGDHIETVGGAHRWTVDAMVDELKLHPERFSPNVVLRPVYQEVILPNLCYIGGGGELAYWLQLKGVFDHWNVPFPILRLRNSVAMVDKRIEHKIEKLSLTTAEFFKDAEVVLSSRVKADLNPDATLQPIVSQMETLYHELLKIAEETDSTLKGSVMAEHTRALKGVERFSSKWVRAAKRKETDTRRMLEEVHANFFPHGKLQERYSNLLTMLDAFGPDFIAAVKSNLDPFEHGVSVLFAD